MIVSLEDVHKSFPDAEGGAPREVLRGIDLKVGQGETMAVVGPSGCGKSTLLNIMGTLDRPDAGRVTVAGRELSGLPERELAALRAEEVGFVFQLHHLMPQATVLENVTLPSLALPARPPAAEVEGRAKALLERVGLVDHLDKKPGQLSGGERQRAAVVRALTNRPSLLLADEPTGALDRQSAEGLVELLLELNRDEGVALVMVTHDPSLAQRMGATLHLQEGGIGEG